MSDYYTEWKADAQNRIKKLSEINQEIREADIELGKYLEHKRIQKVVRNWISELRGHDSDCDCLIKAQVLEDFINHTDFEGE